MMPPAVRPGGHPRLRLAGLRRMFGGQPAVDGVDLDVAAGETVALLGPSGCGKSTTLNMIVGLEQPDGGDIQIDGRSVLGVPPGRRGVGLVFQDYAVFPHMTVRQNLGYGLRIRGMARREVARAVDGAADLLDLRPVLDARPAALGGSQLQRVAIGRTLVTRPAILLLDEPLSNLEAGMRQAMRATLRRLQSETGQTIVYVTHDQVEALSLAHRIAVMQAGRIRQCAPTAEIYAQPGHRFVGGFIGAPPMSFLDGHVSADGAALEADGIVLPLPAPAPPGAAVTFGLRPEDVSLEDGPRAVPATVALLERRGPDAVATLQAGRARLRALVPADAALRPGDPVRLQACRGTLFDRDSGLRLLPEAAE